MRQQEQLAFRVRRGPPRALAVEGVPDLEGVIRAVDVRVTRGADELPVGLADHRERDLRAKGLLVERPPDIACITLAALRPRLHVMPDVVFVARRKEGLRVLHTERDEADVRALERHWPRVERRAIPAREVGHLHVVDVGAAIVHDGVALDALDLEPRRLVRRDRAIVVAHDAQRHAMEAEVLGEVTQEEAERLAAEALAPKRFLADADADLRAARLRHEVAVVREADGPAGVLDDEEATGRRLQARAVDERARRGVIRKTAGVPRPLVPREVGIRRPADEMRCVVVPRDAKRDARAAEDRFRRDRHPSVSASDGPRGPKSGGRALVSRSVISRSRSASSETPRSSSRDPRRRTDTVRDSASRSPTTSM